MNVMTFINCPENGAVYEFHGFVQPMYDSTNGKISSEYCVFGAG